MTVSRDALEQTRELAALAEMIVAKEEALKRRNAAAHEAERRAETLTQKCTALERKVDHLEQEMSRLAEEPEVLRRRLRDAAKAETLWQRAGKLLRRPAQSAL